MFKYTRGPGNTKYDLKVQDVINGKTLEKLRCRDHKEINRLLIYC